MGNERAFVTTLMMRLSEVFEESFVWKPADSFNLGIPDIHAVLPGGHFLAAEVKEVPKLLDKSLEEYKPDRKMLGHLFSGPQISMLRKLKRAGALSVGIVRTHKDLAYYIHPESIPLDGQITPVILHTHGIRMTRQTGWRFW